MIPQLKFRFYLYIIIPLFSISIKAQTLKGTITDEDNNPIPYANIYLEQLKQGIQADEKGFYTLPLPKFGWYQYKISMLGFDDITGSIAVNEASPVELPDKLIKKGKTLDEVTVEGKSDLQKTRDMPLAVSTLDTRQAHNSTLDVNQILNRFVGVRIREEGGLGSGFSFSLNGFTGKQVKFFIDGVPIDNFGSSLTLNNLPINMAERIDVYKGVVPIWLGSDALGGAVNIVTNQHSKNYLQSAAWHLL